MVCGFEILVPILATITAICGMTTAISETLPFLKKLSGNGIIHSITHLFRPEKCITEEIK